jgi:hypothetical protein
MEGGENSVKATRIPPQPMTPWHPAVSYKKPPVTSQFMNFWTFDVIKLAHSFQACNSALEFWTLDGYFRKLKPSVMILPAPFLKPSPS